MIGETVGSYRVTRVLGEGGMGRVYLAEHALIGKRAAIKVLLPQYSAHPDIVNRFFNEARASSLLKHPGVVDIYDFGKLPSGSAFIVMEYLEGESLSARLQRTGPLAVEVLVEVTRQVASALAVAHERGIVHRDLKPDNVFLVPDAETRSGVRAKILDFGIAKLTDNAASGNAATRTGAIIGTPTYMSPEQCRGAGAVDHRSDIYSLGCVMFEMAMGQPPFSGEGPGDVIAAHMFQAPPSLQGRVTAPLAELIARMLAKLPAERVQSMSAVVAGLAHADDGRARRSDLPTVRVPSPTPLPTQAHANATVFAPTPAPNTTLGGAAGEVTHHESGGPSRSGQRILVVAAAATLALGGGLVVWKQSRGRAEKVEPVAAAPTVAAPPTATPAPPQAAATVEVHRTVSLRIDSQPSGAEVLREGVRVGKTPWSLESAEAAGEAVYVVRAKGYRDAEVSVRRDRDVDKSVTLEKLAHRSAPHASSAPKPSEPKPPEPKPIKNGVVDPFAN